MNPDHVVVKAFSRPRSFMRRSRGRRSRHSRDLRTSRRYTPINANDFGFFDLRPFAFIGGPFGLSRRMSPLGFISRPVKWKERCRYTNTDAKSAERALNCSAACRTPTGTSSARTVNPGRSSGFFRHSPGRAGEAGAARVAAAASLEPADTAAVAAQILSIRRARRNFPTLSRAFSRC